MPLFCCYFSYYISCCFSYLQVHQLLDAWVCVAGCQAEGHQGPSQEHGQQVARLASLTQLKGPLCGGHQAERLLTNLTALLLGGGVGVHTQAQAQAQAQQRLVVSEAEKAE